MKDKLISVPIRMDMNIARFIDTLAAETGVHRDGVASILLAIGWRRTARELLHPPKLPKGKRARR
jgi:hypothetical protein